MTDKFLVSIILLTVSAVPIISAACLMAVSLAKGIKAIKTDCDFDDSYSLQTTAMVLNAIGCAVLIVFNILRIKGLL